MRTRKRAVSLQATIVVPLFVLILVVGAVQISVRRATAARSLSVLAAELRSSLSGELGGQMADILRVPETINAGNQILIGRGVIGSRDQSALQAYFRAEVPLFPGISSIYFGNVDGGLAGAGREVDGVTYYITGTDGFEAGPFHKYGEDDPEELGQPLVSVPEFDARTRPWFVRALDGDEDA